MSVWGDERIIDERGVPDLAGAQPLLLSMPDNRYWALGQPVGHAWRDGTSYPE